MVKKSKTWKSLRVFVHNFGSIREAHSLALKPRDQHFAEALSFNGKSWVGWNYCDLMLKPTALDYFLFFFFSFSLGWQERSLPKEYTTTFQTFMIRLSECPVYFPYFLYERHDTLICFAFYCSWPEKWHASCFSPGFGSAPNLSEITNFWAGVD